MIQRRALKKWLFICVLCSAHSFFWGVVANGNILAMALGVLTLAAGFAMIESNARYQMKREASSTFARALDKGVRLRCWLAAIILFAAAIQYIGVKPPLLVRIVVNAPFVAELWIGAQSMEVTQKITGLTLKRQQLSRNEFHEIENEPAEPPISGRERFFATYLTTLFTGLIHTFILGLLCVATYGVIRLRGPKRGDANNHDAPNA